MSLDISLIRNKWVSYDEGKSYIPEQETVYDANITHNLGKMAQEAEIYEALWRPYRLKEDFIKDQDYYIKEMEFEESCVIIAKDIIQILEVGLINLKARPQYFEQFNSPNGWGKYEYFVPFVQKYLEACKEYPEAIIKISR